MKAFMNKKDSCNWYYFDYKYMHDWCKDCPEILNSLSWNTFGFNLSGEDSTIWIGNEGAHTNCHQDSYGCNLVAQIHGQLVNIFNIIIYYALHYGPGDRVGWKKVKIYF